MELAVNTFNKGLLMDTHPMVLSNDTLTDCLNGTLVTQNGNEVILQNDMGNRRIDNAFLPAGYLPVGIKEYGGIIYIAAYNPITNKSQIGSFPSPLRKFNNLSELNSLNLDYFFSNENIYEERFDSIGQSLKFIKNDTLFILLTPNSFIYPGDKFVVYCNNLNSDLISNFNNTNGYKILSPKNKQYTLSLGVLNSLNEFVDITQSLNRWTYNNEEKSTIIKYPNNTSKEYKLNDGYFIAKNYSNGLLSETIEDTKLIKARLSLPINTYNLKLIGPLYLKAYLNHVESFNYSITGYKDEDGSIVLIITGIFTYNCPDEEKE